MTSALATRDYYLNENSTHELDAYHKYMTNLAILLGANVSSAGDELMKVLEFEKQLANVSTSKNLYLTYNMYKQYTYMYRCIYIESTIEQ